MVKPVVHDPILLAGVSRPATAEDLGIARDLLDTLKANRSGCVGMAANMIGQKVRIIVFDCSGKYMTMLNPKIISGSEEYDAEEGCLSLSGTRHTKRWQKITVKYQTLTLEEKTRSFQGFTAQIIQHETDHCNGILI
ncbi:MAG: peptide deformylase [Clostridia bacterium]|nr:peptide deformylase [Clostridia bacterium]